MYKTSRVNLLPEQRGYFGVGLYNPKIEFNVGHVLRACHCFGASFIMIQGNRYKHDPTNVTKAERHIPLIQTKDLQSVIPYDCIPIAVELDDNASSLVNFCHPERAYYIFGPEDGSLGKDTYSWCKYKIYIPSHGCLNLAMSVNIVLYDRIQKEIRRGD